MDNITLNLVVLAVFALIGVIIFYLVRRNQAENQQKIVQMAAEHGWAFESIRDPLTWGLRLKSAQWTLDAISHSSGQDSGSGSSNIAMSTIWHSDASGSILLIGARISQAGLGGYGDMLTRQVMQLALGADAVGLKEISTGSAIFRQRYMVWAQDPREADKLLTHAVESALLAWKGQSPLIKRTSEGLIIELRGVRLQKVGDLCALVHLGELFL